MLAAVKASAGRSKKRVEICDASIRGGILQQSVGGEMGRLQKRGGKIFRTDEGTLLGGN